MELRILGPTEVRHDGSAVTLRGAKPRQLLVLLAMRPNRPVPAEELIEELWDGEPPPSAATALRVHVGRLRQVLEPARNPSAPSGRLPAGPHGYLLRIEPDELDVQRFERLLVLAREADANGDPSRGRAPADRSPRPLARRRARRRPRSRRDPGRDRPARGATGRGHRGTGRDTARARRARPGGRRARVRLSRSIRCASGSRKASCARCTAAAATPKRSAAYADLAHRLDEELGLEPSARLRRLEEDVLLQRPTLDFVAPRSLTHLSAQRGWSSTRFIGRRNELRDLVELYDGGRHRAPARRARGRSAGHRQDHARRGVLRAHPVPGCSSPRRFLRPEPGR